MQQRSDAAELVGEQPMIKQELIGEQQLRLVLFLEVVDQSGVECYYITMRVVVVFSSERRSWRNF